MNLNPSKLNLLFAILLTSLLLLAPFVIASALKNRFETGPELWIWLLSGIWGIYWGILAISFVRTRRAVFFNRIDLVILMSLAWVLLASVTQDKRPYFSDHLISYCSLTAVYFFFRSSLSFLDAEDLKTFSRSIVVILSMIVLCAAGWGILQMIKIIPSYNENFLVTGMFFNPARYGNHLNALAPVLLSAYFFLPDDDRSDKLIKKIAGFCFLMALVGIVLSYTRAAWVGTACCLLLILYLKFPSIYKGRSRLIWLTVGVIVISTATGMILFKLKPASALGRLTVWEISKNIVIDNPVTGIGYGNFKHTYNQYQAGYFSAARRDESIIQRSDTVRYAYNALLQVLVEQGIVGILLFLSLICFLARHFIGLIKSGAKYVAFLSIAAFSSILAILICGLFSYPFDILPVQIIFFIATGLIAALESKLPVRDFPRFRIEVNRVTAGVPGILAIGGSMLLINLAIQRYKAYRQWALLDNAAAVELRVLYKDLGGDGDFLADYAGVLVKEKKFQAAADVLEEGGYLLLYPSDYQELANAYAGLGKDSYAEHYFLLAVHMVPNRLLSRFLLAEFYYKNGQLAKCRALLNEVLTAKIKIQSYTADDVLFKAKSLLLKCEQKQENADKASLIP